MRIILPALVAGAALLFPAPAAAQAFPDDAALRAVQFLDPDVGYAVGDDGVILKTINGGKSWELLPSNVRASLRSLHMLTHLVGWVVGREELPQDTASAGVILHTEDGGETWRRLYPDTVPGLNHIRFGDANTGFMLGDANEQYPTGVLMTHDGGRKWSPMTGARATTWLSGDFLDGKTATLAGAWSRLGAIRNGAYGKLEMDELGGRNLSGVLIRLPRSFAVGQGGLVLRSGDGGLKWGFADLKLPQEVLASWDFHAVTAVADKVWIVGRPGSVVLYSDDKGTNWRIFKTGQNVPLHAVHFFDENRGWAVGEFGCILASGDGGKTWKVQRRGGQRAAILCVHALVEFCPLDTVAMLAGEHGLLTAAIRVSAPDPKSEAIGEAVQAQRFAAANRAAGGGAGEMLWPFPAPQNFLHADKADLLKYWDRLHGDRADQQLLRQLVLAIRMWQPSLVLTDHPDFKVGGNAAGALVAEALHEAFRQAADAKAFPEQIEFLGLKPWQATKLYGLWDKRDGSHVAVDNQREIATWLATPAEHSSQAALLLATPPPSMPLQRHYRLLASANQISAAEQSLVAGIDFGLTGVCRRQMPALPEQDANLTAALKVQRQLLSLAKNSDKGLKESPRLLGTIATTLGKMPEDRGAKAALAIAGEFARQGQWDLAREAFIAMVERYPTHPLSVEACRWLIRHNSSSEARRRDELDHFLIARLRGEAEGPFAGANPKLPGPLKPGEIEQVTFLANPAQLLHWHQGSLALGKRLAGFGPLHAADPSIQFCLQASTRHVGNLKDAMEYYGAYWSSRTEGVWRDVAGQELWLVNRSGVPPRPVAKCTFTPAKPYLDGKLDDACWNEQTPLVLKDAIQKTATEYPTEARFSYDDKFLYISLTCKHPVGQGLPPAKERPRDSDLRAFDRVSILLDLDRDYSTCFHLQVDQRGCVCEDCWGDLSWNPKWFVAVRTEEDCWQIEAAVPLHELTGKRIISGAAWACNVVRILPGRGVQAWSQPAGAMPRPEGLGLMIFQQGDPKSSKIPAPK